MGEIRAKINYNRGNLNLAAEVYPIFKVLAESAAPRMIGVSAVAAVFRYAVYRVALKEAGLLARYEIRNGVGELFRHVVSIVRVK